MGEEVVPSLGLEPRRLSAPEPKSGASTNFATTARGSEEFYHGDWIELVHGTICIATKFIFCGLKSQ